MNRLGDLWSYNKDLLFVLSESYGEKGRRKSGEGLKEIMAENFPDVVKGINL